MNNLFNLALDKYKKLSENKAARQVIMAILGIVLVFGLVFQNVFTASAGVTTLELLPQPDAGLNSTGTVWANWHETKTGGTWTTNQGYTTANWYVDNDAFDPTATAIGSWRSYRGALQDTLQTAYIWHTFTVPAAYNPASDTLVASFYWKKLIGNNNIIASNVKWKVFRDSDQVEMGSGTLNSATAANTSINWTQQNINLKTDLSIPVSAGVTYRLWLGHESRIGSVFSSSDVAFDVARVTLTSTQIPTTVNVTSSKAVIDDDNIDSTTVSAYVYDQFGQPVNSQTVDFARSPEIGSLSAGSAVTDAGGLASVTFKANNDGGSSVTLTATAGSASGQTTVSVLTPQTLTAGASPTAIPNDNSTTSTITVQLKDNNGDPMSGEQVNFSTDLGTLSAASAITDGSGSASVTLRADTGGTAAVTAAVNRKPAVSTSAGVSVLAPTTLTLSASPAAIPNDNNTTATITAHLEDQNGDPMSGEQLNLSTDLGTLSAATGTTNASGDVTVTLKSGSAGTATVTGSVTRAPAVTGSTAVTVVAPEPATLNVSASPTYVRANDTDTATVTVHLEDQIGNPMEGETVNITTDRGTLSTGSAVTDASGNASVTVKSASVGTATLTATAASKPTVSGSDIVNFYIAEPTTLTMSRSSTTVPNNNVSTSTITAHLVDQNGMPISGRKINFATNLGTLSAASAVTDTSGDAEVTIRSDSDGTATVTGAVDGAAGVTASTTVFFAAPAPSIITISAGPRQVPADNSSTSTVSVHLTDQFGNPVIGETVNFSTNRGTLSAATAVTDGSGDAAVTIRSGIASPATVFASAASKPAVNGVVSVVFTVPDVDPPAFIKAEATSKQIVYLTFSEAIKDPNTAGSTISVDGGIVVQQVYLMEDARIVRLLLSNDQGTGNQYPAPLSYTVNVTDIEDISGNNLASAAREFDAFTPHGKYAPDPVTSDNSNRICGQCHSAHSSVGNGLLNGLTIKKVCFICHGIAGTSVYRVENEFYNWDDANVAAAVYSTSLHKALDADSPGYDLLTCVDCHDPHGTKRPGTNEIYPKLLSARNVNGAVYTSADGNWFCLACHGFGDANPAFRNRLGDYWNGTGGLHDWGMTVAADVYYGVHYDNRMAALQPASGTNITCVVCHERHGSENSKLTVNDEAFSNRPDSENAREKLCYKCHDSANSMTPGYDVKDRFANGASKHDIFDEDSTGLSCSSCHGPHSVAARSFAGSDGTSPSAISDPANTKLNYNTSSGDMAGFCNKCHDVGNGGGTAVSAVTNATTVVPYTVSYPAASLSNYLYSWNKKIYFDSSSTTKAGHYNPTRVPVQPAVMCDNCHDPHGSDNSRLSRYGEDPSAGGPTSAGMCLRCHGNLAGTAGADIPALDVWSSASGGFNSTYKHPTFNGGGDGIHSDTENYQTVSRHAECQDCHDPHSATTDGTPDDDLLSLAGMKGLEPTYSAGNWGAVIGGDWDQPVADTREYRLCYKCHSDLSSGATGLGLPATKSVAREFNPNNGGYHWVGYGSARAGVSGTYTAGWNSTSRVQCSNCHGASGTPASVLGAVHGSSQPNILKAQWDDTVNYNTNGALCFLCHSQASFTNSSAASSFKTSSGGNNLHAKSDHRLTCQTCHSKLPHGGKRPGLLVIMANSPLAGAYGYDASYDGSSKYNDNPGSTTKGLYLSAWKSNGGYWRKSDCGCDGAGH